MTTIQLQHFFDTIDQFDEARQARWGKMTIGQMLCHCADQIRIALGTKIVSNPNGYTATEILHLAQNKQTVPAPKGMGQQEGEGTLPTTFEADKATLKTLIQTFLDQEEDYAFSPHPYFGTQTKAQWEGFIIYHLNYHFRQFGEKSL
jgi:hypothetical protein